MRESKRIMVCVSVTERPHILMSNPITSADTEVSSEPMCPLRHKALKYQLRKGVVNGGRMNCSICAKHMLSSRRDLP